MNQTPIYLLAAACSLVLTVEFFPTNGYAQPTESDLRNAYLAALRAIVPNGNSQFVHCIEIGGKDAAPDILDSLAKSGRNVEPVSKCTYVIEDSGSYVNSTHASASFVRLKSFRYTSEGKGEVEWSDYHHGLWGGFGVVYLELRAGEWVATVAQQGVS
jgi:hypothetical protein